MPTNEFRSRRLGASKSAKWPIAMRKPSKRLPIITSQPPVECVEDGETPRKRQGEALGGWKGYSRTVFLRSGISIECRRPYLGYIFKRPYAIYIIETKSVKVLYALYTECETPVYTLYVESKKRVYVGY